MSATASGAGAGGGIQFASDSVGNRGARGAPLLNVLEYQDSARRHLAKAAYTYFAGGCEDNIALRENVAALLRLKLRPRVLTGAKDPDLAVTLLGRRVGSPLAIAPAAFHLMAHPDGECGTSKAAADSNTLMVLSSWSTTSLEDVAAIDPAAPRWFQLYVCKDRDVTRDLVVRAEAAGYQAIVLTVDRAAFGRREDLLRTDFKLPPHLRLGNFTSKVSGRAARDGDIMKGDLTWEDVKWLKSITKLPVVLKGIMTAEDTELAVEAGAAAVWVSNHGARQLDSVCATIDVLEEIVGAAKGRLEVYMDGGVRRGSDVFKALALGANAVFIGRPVIWGLAHAGHAGVARVLTLMQEELKNTMVLAGCKSVKDVA